MGYSRNPITVEKLMPELGRLRQGKPEAWQKGEAAQLFAYKLHEMFSIAKRYPNRYPFLARAATEMRVKIENGTVFVLPKGEPAPAEYSFPAPQSLQLPPAFNAALEPLFKVESLFPGATLTAPRSVGEVIQFWLDKQPSAEPVALLDVALTNAEIQQLVKWTANLEPAWAVTHETGSTSIILQLDSPELKNKL